MYDRRALLSMTSAPRHRHSTAVHALLVGVGYGALFTWLFADPIITRRLFSESDLFDYFLPIFLAPITTWSSWEFSGLPAFADPGDFVWYPPHFFFARVAGSWNGFVISAFVLAAAFTYAYVYRVTRSRTASAFAGLAYAMSEALVERVAHLGTLHGFAWLPLILLSIEHLRERPSRRWMAVGGIAVASAFLAGHPQPFVYTAYLTLLYALVAGIVERAPRSYYLSVAGLYAVGGMLASIKALPLVEASFLMARQFVNPAQFSSHGNTVAQMLSLLFPTVLHEGREAPTYVGLATLLFAFVGASMWRGNWRVAFWTCAGVVALVLGMGDATPLPRVLYAVVPLYDKFRVAARHLFIAAFGATFLAAFALAAIQRGAIAPRRVRAAALVLLLSIAAGAIVQATVPAAFEYEPRLEAPVQLPIWNTGVWVQFGLAAVTAVAALVVRAGRRFVAGVALLMVLLYLDNLYSLFYADTQLRLIPITVARDATQPSVHDEHIGRDLDPLRQRALAIGGSARDVVIPAGFARVWKIPIAGGYGPMLLQRTSDFAMMGHDGGVRPSILDSHDLALDLLAVRDILVQRDDVADPATFDQDGVTWDRNELAMPLGRSDCNFSYPRSDYIPLPADVTISELAIVSYLRCSEDVTQGTEVARVRVVTDSRTVTDQSFLAGRDTADAALSDASVLQRARHRIPANAFHDPSGARALRFLSRVTLASPVRGGRLELTAPGTYGWFTIDRLTVIDEQGLSHPLGAPRMWLSDAERWRKVSEFATSRVSDRGADRPAPLEVPYTVYENLRALPRAWMTTDVKTISDGDALAAIRHGQLPDGSRFDPRTTALVSPDGPAVELSHPGRNASATVEEIVDGRITVTAASDAGGFLVLSESHYPGWRARIDGVVTPVRRVDFLLQGVPVAPGRHTVVFEFVSNTLRAGAAISVVGVLLCTLLIAGPITPRKERETGPVHVDRIGQNL